MHYYYYNLQTNDNYYYFHNYNDVHAEQVAMCTGLNKCVLTQPPDVRYKYADD